MSDRIENIEEMTSKIIEYIQVTSEGKTDYELQCMACASKFLLAGFFQEGTPVELSGDAILDKCNELFHIIINCAFD